MNILPAIILGVVEGVTEFLPVSSTGHLTIVEKLMGLPLDDAGVTAFTAIIQTGAIVAVIVYFWRDIATLLSVWFLGLRNREVRSRAEYRLAWAVIVGSISIGVVGLLAKDYVSGPLRNLWVVAGALVVWSAVMHAAERVATQRRSEEQVTLRRRGCRSSYRSQRWSQPAVSKRRRRPVTWPTEWVARDGRFHRGQLRRRVRLDRVVAAIRRRPSDHGVRRLPSAARHRTHRRPVRRCVDRGVRSSDGDWTPVGGGALRSCTGD